MIAQNIAYAALQAGYTVLFRTASDILTDLHCDSPQILRRRLQRYARPGGPEPDRRDPGLGGTA
jgi:hypothetical protein